MEELRKWIEANLDKSIEPKYVTNDPLIRQERLGYDPQNPFAPLYLLTSIYGLSLLENRPRREFYDYGYPPFVEIRKEIGEGCITSQVRDKFHIYPRSVERNGIILDTLTNLKYIIVSEGESIYKQMDGFYDAQVDRAFARAYPHRPIWYTNILERFVMRFSPMGGICAYRTIRDLKILIISCYNIKILIELAKTLPETIPIRGEEMTRERAIDLLRVAACHEEGLGQYVRTLGRFVGDTEASSFWLSENHPYCEVPWVKGESFGFGGPNYVNNYPFAEVISYLNDHFLGSRYDGHIVPLKASLHTDYIPEELILFRNSQSIQRNTLNPFDWYQYASYLPFDPPVNIFIKRKYFRFNYDHRLMTRMRLNSSSPENLEKIRPAKIFYYQAAGWEGIANCADKIVPGIDASVCSYDFRPEAVRKEILAMIELSQPSKVILDDLKEPIEIEGYDLTYHIRKRVCIYSRRSGSTTVSSMVAVLPQKNAYDPRGNFPTFVEVAEANYELNIEVLDSVLINRPQVLFVRTSLGHGLPPSSPEFDQVRSRGYRLDPQPTSILGSNTTSVFLRDDQELGVVVLELGLTAFCPIMIC